MSDIIKPYQIEQRRQQAQRRQAERATDRRAWQTQLVAALQDDHNRARADALLAQLLVPDGTLLTTAERIAVVAVAALVLDGALAHDRDWGGKHLEAALRAQLRRQPR
jgi:hypothetical protein